MANQDYETRLQAYAERLRTDEASLQTNVDQANAHIIELEGSDPETILFDKPEMLREARKNLTIANVARMMTSQALRDLYKTFPELKPKE